MHIKRRQPCDSLSPRSCLTAKIRLKNWDALTKRHYYNEITNNESFNKTFLLGFTTVLIFGILLDHCNWTIHLFSNHSQFPLAFSLHILNSPWLSYTKRGMCCPLASLDSVTIYLFAFPLLIWHSEKNPNNSDCETSWCCPLASLTATGLWRHFYRCAAAADASKTQLL